MRSNVCITAVIPTYNPNINHLATGLRSVLMQKGVDELEIIVVDDSTDNRVSRLLDTTEFSQIYLIDGPREGVGAARSLGYNLAKHDLIAHMDGDDICHPLRFFLQAAVIHSGIDLCGTNTCYFGDKRGWQTFIESDAAIRFSLAFGAFISQPSVMVNRRALKDDGLFSALDICEDYESWCRQAAKGYRFCNLRKRLLRYRVHGTQATAKKKDRIAEVSADTRLKYIDEAGYGSRFREFFVAHNQDRWSLMTNSEINEFWHISLEEGLQWGVHPQDLLRIFYAVFGRSPALSPRLLATTLYAPRLNNLWLDFEIQLKSKLSIMRKIKLDDLGRRA
ncbi:glycosyltransferase family 2 protein [Chromobacterium violaceum]|uniref:glycosyltransferase family 2 protein n=1 Tax=Chromobacterium violaceum TaxID=536 RepID=UPI001CE15C2F|nr:glycosyltransferase [Chromobacterium violaceum]